jgi:hypothetical protein
MIKSPFGIYRLHGLEGWELSAIEKAAQAITGWTATAFDCQCCGRTTAAVTPTCEAADGPSFEISRDGRKILLTTTWLDGEDYYSEHPSVPAALGVMRVAISRGSAMMTESDA